ncbi:MAG: UDP-glucose--dolichyl-phosphate glucosyltransferase [Verrucomicrobia bacterium]|nr:MAG: UDP-glucose--dolichyl-phosphate glucosyltransferase [Verrucomicrobiota bacterium]
MNVSVVVPALNEEEPIGTVVREIIATGIPREVVVVDNESTDRTAEEAKSAGADVVSAPRGYGRACAAGAAAVSKDCDVIVFLDGDGSDVPALMPSLLDPIYNGTHDFVIGSRSRGQREPGSMNFQQVFAGYLAGFLIHLLYGVRALAKLDMREKTYGWNLEMQMKAARIGLRILEVPVDHRRRAGGASKVSGTLRGTFLAGFRIVATFLRIALAKS